MKTKKRVVIPTLISLAVLFMGYLASLWLIETIERNEELRAVNKKIIDSNAKDWKKIRAIKIELAQEREKTAQAGRDILNHKKKDAILSYYKKHGMIQQYPWVTPQYIYNVVCWADKYKGLSVRFNFDTFDKQNFALAWACNESNFDASCKYVNRHKDKSADWGLMQINDHNLWLFQKLPDGIKRDKLCAEASMACWFLWTDSPGSQQGVWDIWERFRKEGGQEMYYILRSVK